MNPIFGKNPEKAAAIARALGAVQGSKSAPEERLQAFWGLASPPRPHVLSVTRENYDGAPAVRFFFAVRFRVGPVHATVYMDMVRQVGTGDDYTRIWRLALYSAPHRGPDYPHPCPRCRRYLLALSNLGLGTWEVSSEPPDGFCGRKEEGWHAMSAETISTEYIYAILPDLVTCAERAAREKARQVEEALR